MTKRLVYLGTPEMAVAPLRALHAAGHDVVLVVTQPDKRRGRGGGTSPSPVKALAIELGLPVSHVVDDVIATGADLGVVVAFGRLIKPHVLDAVPMINVHFSLLPRWRGAAPVERALLAGDAETGVCIMDVDVTLDTGAIYAAEAIPIAESDTADDLRERLVDVGTRLLVDVVAHDPLPTPTPQVGDPTYAEKFSPEEWELDWSTPAAAARALGPRRPRLDDVPRQAAPGARGHARRCPDRRPCARRARRGRSDRRGRQRRRAARSSATRGQGPDVVARLRERRGARARRGVRIASRPMHDLNAKVLTVSDGVVAGTARTRAVPRWRRSWPRPDSTWSRSTSPPTARTRSPPHSSG